MKEKEAHKWAGTRRWGRGEKKRKGELRALWRGKGAWKASELFPRWFMWTLSRSCAWAGTRTGGNGAADDFTEAGTKAVVRHGRNKYETVALSVGVI